MIYICPSDLVLGKKSNKITGKIENILYASKFKVTITTESTDNISVFRDFLISRGINVSKVDRNTFTVRCSNDLNWLKSFFSALEVWNKYNNCKCCISVSKSEMKKSIKTDFKNYSVCTLVSTYTNFLSTVAEMYNILFKCKGLDTSRYSITISDYLYVN